MFDAAKHYLGMGVGEHLGYFFTAARTLVIGIVTCATNPNLWH